jgi:hypothetical protein
VPDVAQPAHLPERRREEWRKIAGYALRGWLR